MSQRPIGRERELKALVSLVTSVSERRGGALAIVGAPGMGKSCLLESARMIADEGPVRVVLVGCSEFGAAVPLTAAAGLAQAVGTTVDAGTDALGDAILADPRAAPLLILLDDAQWLDTASLPFVLAVAQVAEEAAVALAVAARPPAADGAALQRLLASLERRGAPILHLEALRDDHAIELATDVAGGPLDVDQRAVLATATGNPFLVLELANSWRNGHRPRPESVVMHSLAELSTAARQLLDHASVLGREARIVDLAHLAGCRPVELVDVVREVTSSGLVDGSGDHLQIRHDLIRDAIYDALPSAVRAAIHLGAARALEARGAPSMALAVHLIEGALPGDTSAVEWLRMAASEAARSDLTIAISLLEAARRICTDDKVRTAIERRLIVLYGWTGRGPDAVALATPLLARTTDPHQEARLRVSVAEAIALGGDEEAGAREAELALAIPDLPNRIRASLLVLASTKYWATEPARCRELTTQARQLAGEDRAVVIAAVEHEAAAFSAEVSLVAFLDRAREGSRMAQAADTAAEFLAPARLTWALSNEAEACLANDRVDEGLRLLHAAEHRVRTAGLPPTQIAEHCALRAEAHILLCRWDDAWAELDARLQLLTETRDPETSTAAIPMRTVSMRARIAVVTGQRSAPTLLEEWAAAAGNPYERARVALWFAHQAASVADLEAALRHALDVVETMRWARDTGQAAPRAFGWQASWVEALLVLVEGGHTVEAEDVIEVMLGPVRANSGLPRWDADGLVASAVASGVSANGHRDLAAAASVAQRIAAPLTRFRVLCDVARAARIFDATAVTAQVEPLVQAAASQHGLMLPDASRPSRPPSTRPTSGWESLTPSEQRVARLVAEGLSNRAIADELLISRYTVETHLKRIFQKLHLASRVELATFVIRRP